MTYRRFPFLLFIASLLFAAPRPAPAADSATPTLSLLDCLATALHGNLGLRADRYDFTAAQREVDVERAVFDAVIDLGAMYSEVDRQAGPGMEALSAYNPVAALPRESQTRTVEGGVEKFLSTGTTVRGEFSHTRTYSNDIEELGSFINEPGMNDYLSEYTLSLSQELLQGFGPGVNRTSLVLQQLEAGQETERFRNQVLDLVARVERAYWDYVLSISELHNANLSLELALDLERRNRRKEAIGVLPRLEIHRAQAAVAARRQEVIQRRTAMENARDRLLRLMGLPRESPLWDQPVIPADRPLYVPVHVDTAASLAMALQHRPDVQIAQRGIDIADRDQAYRQNQLLPSLTATGSITTSGNEGDSQDDAHDTATGRDYVDYAVGVQFSYPLHNRADRARYANAIDRHQQAQTRYEDLLQQVRVDIRNAAREVRSAQSTIEAASATVMLSRDVLDREQKSLEAGRSTSRDVLEAQEDLVAANVSYNRALVQYMNALVTLEERKGTLLQSHQIVIGKDGVGQPLR